MTDETPKLDPTKDSNQKTDWQKSNAEILDRLPKFFIGLYVLISGLFFIYALIVMWPIGGYADTNPQFVDETTFLGLRISEWSPDARIAAVVALAGAIGGYVHIGSAFVARVANDHFDTRWVWWYVQRPLIGASLALIFYFMLRGGLLTAGAADDLNIYGLAAVGGLAGLSSAQATAKLKDVFENIFAVSKEDRK